MVEAAATAQSPGQPPHCGMILDLRDMLWGSEWLDARSVWRGCSKEVYRTKRARNPFNPKSEELLPEMLNLPCRPCVVVSGADHRADRASVGQILRI